jgi:hypothetical protein
MGVRSGKRASFNACKLIVVWNGGLFKSMVILQAVVILQACM